MGTQILEKHVKESLELVGVKKENKILIAFSGGKDSTAVLGLFLLAKRLGVHTNFEVMHSDTTMEIPFMAVHIDRIKKICFEENVKFHHVMADVEQRFLFNVIGKGVAVPNRSFRWCTDKLKISPIKKLTKELFKKESIIVANGERKNESANRDRKLNKLGGCGNSSECGLAEQKKILDPHESNNLFRPVLTWTTCQVWDFLFFMDMEGILPDTFEYLSEIYSINETDTGSLRTGCIGCPLVTKDKSLEAFVTKHPAYQPLTEVKQVYENLRLPANRIMRPDGKTLGAIRLQARKDAWDNLLRIEKLVQQKDPNFLLLAQEEKDKINSSLEKGVFPRGYPAFAG